MESFSRQLKRAALLGLLGLATLLLIDSIKQTHAFHETHFLPVDVSVFVVAALVAMLLVPFRFRKPER